MGVFEKRRANNRRSNHFLEYRGKRQTVMQWSEELKINCFTLYTRLADGWTVERALSTPTNNNGGSRRWKPPPKG